jgi:hypothetical protein
VKSCLAAKQNPPSASQHAMPGQVLKVVYTQSPGNLTGSPRVACAARHFPVGGDLAPRNAPNGALNVCEIRHDFLNHNWEDGLFKPVAAVRRPGRDGEESFASPCSTVNIDPRLTVLLPPRGRRR